MKLQRSSTAAQVMEGGTKEVRSMEMQGDLVTKEGVVVGDGKH